MLDLAADRGDRLGDVVGAARGHQAVHGRLRVNRVRMTPILPATPAAGPVAPEIMVAIPLPRGIATMI
ncbi:hypothetical protein GCM10023322_45030 [Rugosimonospora acidiphila]|uniref:Uncharacterized protein n=1 Tax=Rugosimonospora acidiphila TaxID=556531 RepID=A0ABP9S302_9ACTN